jgi:hypothetical protein
VHRSGEFLRRLYGVGESRAESVELADLAKECLRFVDGELEPAGLRFPVEARAALTNVPTGEVRTRAYHLHGDFAPVNFIVDRAGTLVGFDIGGSTLGMPEADLSRYLALLATDRMFLLGPAAFPVEILRHKLEHALLTGYGAPAPSVAAFELHKIDALARRWLQRDITYAELGGGPRGARSLMSRRVRSLLTESARALQTAYSA